MTLEERFYTPEEVAKLLRVKLGTIYSWTSSRKITFVKLSGSKILISATALDAWLASRQVAALGSKSKGESK